MSLLPYLVPSLAEFVGVPTIGTTPPPAQDRAPLLESMGCQSWPLDVLKGIAADRKAVAA